MLGLSIYYRRATVATVATVATEVAAVADIVAVSIADLSDAEGKIVADANTTTNIVVDQSVVLSGSLVVAHVLVALMAVAVLTVATVAVAIVAVSVEETRVAMLDVAASLMEVIGLVESLLVLAFVLDEADLADRAMANAAVAAAIAVEATVILVEGTVANGVIAAILKLTLDVAVGKLNLEVVLNIGVAHVGLNLELSVLVNEVDFEVGSIVLGEATAMAVAVTDAVTNDIGGVGTVSLAEKTAGRGASEAGSRGAVAGSGSSGAIHVSVGATETGHGGGGTAGTTAGNVSVAGVVVTVRIAPLSGADGGGEDGKGESLHDRID